MKQEIKEIAEVITNNPKVGYLVATLTGIETWWVNWGNPLVDAVASILGVILLVVLIRKHWNTGSNSDKQG